MCKNNPLKKFRTLEGAQRREAMRAHLGETNDLRFDLDPHELTFSQRSALSDMAKAVSWRKSPTSCLSLGAAFYVYLSRDAKAKPARIAAPAAPRRSIAFGRGFA